MWLQLRFSKPFQHMLVSFAEIQSINACDLLDLKLLNSRSNQELNMLSKIIQKALHIDQRGHASLCGHVTSEQKPAVPWRYFQIFCSEELSPSSCPVRDMGILSQPHWKASLCHMEDTQQGSIRSSNQPHGKNCKSLASTRNVSRPDSMRGLQLNLLCCTAEKNNNIRKYIYF